MGACFNTRSPVFHTFLPIECQIHNSIVAFGIHPPFPHQTKAGKRIRESYRCRKKPVHSLECEILSVKLDSN